MWERSLPLLFEIWTSIFIIGLTAQGPIHGSTYCTVPTAAESCKLTYRQSFKRDILCLFWWQIDTISAVVKTSAAGESEKKNTTILQSNHIILHRFWTRTSSRRNSTIKASTGHWWTWIPNTRSNWLLYNWLQVTWVDSIVCFSTLPGFPPLSK